VWAGPEENTHLKAPPLLHAVTNGSTPFRLVTHVGDVGHTLVLGPSGSGKSVLLNLMEAQFLRYAGAQVYIFDKGGSARIVTAGMGGDYYDLGADDSKLCFQPLSGIDLDAERRWAHEWVLEILGKENVVITPQIKEELWTALSSLATAKADERTVFGLTLLLQNELLRQALLPYTLQGAHGHLLDNSHDNLRYARWQCFEMEVLMDTPSVVMPVLSYLFHRLEQRFDGRPTMLVLDEAWLFLDHPAFAAKIREWLKVLRKANVMVVFATQSLADIDESPIAATIKEACFTKIYLPNANALNPDSTRFYERFGLNERQIEILALATPKRDYYYSLPYRTAPAPARSASAR
jgi:type IV secretion system protein TrbE